MTKPKSTNSKIRDLAKILDETGLTQIEVEEGDLKIKVARSGATHVSALPHAAAPAPAEAVPAAGSGAEAEPVDPSSHPGVIKSPMVGTAYTSPEPGADTFVSVGDQVTEGQTLLIVEAMKVMNPIPSPRAGTVKEVFISNAQPIEFDEPLMIIE